MIAYIKTENQNMVFFLFHQPRIKSIQLQEGDLMGGGKEGSLAAYQTKHAADTDNHTV